MSTQTTSEAKGGDNEAEPSSVVRQLRRHYLKHVQDVNGKRQIDFLAFAYNSPFDLPSPKEFASDYQDTDISELRALQEQAEESSQIYFSILESAIEDGTDAPKELKKRWREFCQIVARKSVVQILLTSAAIHGPQKYDEMIQDWEDPLASGPIPASMKDHSVLQEIAAKILEVLGSSPSEWPSSMNDLLLRVDELRGVKERTTYRYLHDKMEDDKPQTMHDWKEWAEHTV